MPTALVEGLKERIFSSISMYQSLGVVIPGTNYNDIVRALFDCIREHPNDKWIYITITRPFDSFARLISDINAIPNVTFIDCISRASGIVKKDEKCVYIESPTMLEHIMIEAMNIFERLPPGSEKYLILDSLSALMIYNDPSLVTEFFYQLLNRARCENIRTISLVVEEGEEDRNINRLIYLNDKILKVRDTFI
ncbi:MAG: hypothetical protein FE037_04165 [Thermoplasmata archaeon]|nr:MAG: hypothetical protein FE042_02660 [Thermoplasmata archaeon]KAA0011062.1 MAG: hypothetical protein FE037_04165 [Thermoplasmata archaeon]RLF50534.1 MAG: hypothetical protein DRN19_04365 [Thermoplasmata archaeon]